MTTAAILLMLAALATAALQPPEAHIEAPAAVNQRRGRTRSTEALTGGSGSTSRVGRLRLAARSSGPTGERIPLTTTSTEYSVLTNAEGMPADEEQGVPAAAHLTSAVYTEEQTVALYESFYPLLISVNLPAIQPLNYTRVTQKEDPLCSNVQGIKVTRLPQPQPQQPSSAHPQLLACLSHRMTGDLVANLESFMDSSDPVRHLSLPVLPKSRQQRAGFLSSAFGEVLKFCCSAVVQSDLAGLRSNEAKVQRYMDTLSASVAEDHQFLGNVTQRVNLLAVNAVQFRDEAIRQFNSLTANLEEAHKYEDLATATLSRDTLLLAHAVQRHAQVTELQQALNLCRQHMFPLSVVVTGSVEAKLNSLAAKLRAVDRVIVTPSDSYQSLLDLPLTDCHLTETRLMITLRVPIAKAGHMAKAVHVTSVPFRANQTLCAVTLPTQRLIISKGRAQPMGSDPLCMQGLCRFADHPNHYTAESVCLDALIRDTEPQQIAQACRVTCSPAQLPAFTRIDALRLAVVTNTALRLACDGPTGTTAVPVLPSDLGYTLITAGCHCTIQSAAEHILVQPVFPCPAVRVDTQAVAKLPLYFIQPDALQQLVDVPLQQGGLLVQANTSLDPRALSLAQQHYQPLTFKEDTLAAFAALPAPSLTEWERPGSTWSLLSVIGFATVAMAAGAFCWYLIKLARKKRVMQAAIAAAAATSGAALPLAAAALPAAAATNFVTTDQFDAFLGAVGRKSGRRQGEGAPSERMALNARSPAIN
jgi:hypothetical protein